MQQVSKDIGRQVAVLAATSFMLIAAMVGVGLFGGTSVEDLQNGALDSDGSYLAPAGSAFSIWSVIYIGLIAYAVWQALPGQRRSARQRRVGWWIALTEVLNGLWLVTAQFTTLPLTVLTIFLLLAVLAITFRLTRWTTSSGPVESVLVDGVTGLHLGWVTLAAVANVSAWLTQIAPASWEDAAEPVAIAVLAVVAVIGVAIAAWGRGRIAPMLALVWGLSWLAVGRLVEQPESMVAGVAAIVAAGVVLLATVVFRLRAR